MYGGTSKEFFKVRCICLPQPPFVSLYRWLLCLNLVDLDSQPIWLAMTNKYSCISPGRLARVVECLELYAGGLRVDPPSCLPLLHALLNVPTRSGTKISADRFTLGIIPKMRGNAPGKCPRFPCKVFLGKKSILVFPTLKQYLQQSFHQIKESDNRYPDS